MIARAAGVGSCTRAVRLPRQGGASCALLLVLALVLQLVPLVAIDPEPEVQVRGLVGAPILHALDVCSAGDEIGGRGADHPVLPAPTALIALRVGPAFVLTEVSFTLSEGFPRLPLRPPRS